jgi:hypothetical protein
MNPLEYSTIDALIPKIGSAIVKPALKLSRELLNRKTRRMDTRSLDEFDDD